jgi:hypothetical protein
LCILPEDGQQGPKHVAAKYIKYKHPEELLQGTVLRVTSIKYAQQDAEPQNKKGF